MGKKYYGKPMILSTKACFEKKPSRKVVMNQV